MPTTVTTIGIGTTTSGSGLELSGNIKNVLIYKIPLDDTVAEGKTN